MKFLYWSFLAFDKLKVYITTNTKEKPSTIIDDFCKIGKAKKKKSKEWTKFELGCLLQIFINFSSNFEVICNNMDFNWKPVYQDSYQRETA